MKNFQVLLKIFSFLLFVSPASQLHSQELQVFTAQSKNWLRFSNAPNALNLHLLEEAEKHFHQRDHEVSKLRSPEEVRARQLKVLETLNALIPLDSEKTDLKATTTRTITRKGYTVELIVFQSKPGFYVTGSLFLPDQSTQKPAPAILFCSGHSAQAYRRDIYQRPLLNLVEKGFIVFAIDPPGQGERLQYPDPENGGSKIGSSTKEHSYPMAQTALIGESVAQYFIWDGIRAIDYLVSRPEVDPTRIGVHGLSGGGTQTAYISAFDDRVKAAAPSGYITNFRRLFQSIGAQDGEQNFYRGIANGIDHPELLLARAPKPTLIMATTRDFFSIEGTRETYNEMRRMYELLGEKNNINLTEGDHGHGYTENIREAMYAFFQKHLELPGSPEEKEVELIPEKDLQITPTGQVASSYGSKNIFDLNKEKSISHLKSLKGNRENANFSSEELVKQIIRITGYQKPEGVESPFFTGRLQKDQYVIEKYFIAGEGDYSLPFLLFIPSEKNGKGILYLHPEGKDAAAEGEILRFVREGFTVLSPDLPGTGELSPDILRGDAIIDGVPYNTWFTGMTIGRSIVGIRAGDIVRLARSFRAMSPVTDLTGIAKNEIGPVLLHSAVFEDLFETIILNGSLMNYESILLNPYYQPALVPHLVPGALLAYDLPDLVTLFSPGKILLSNSRNEKGETVSQEKLKAIYHFSAKKYLSLEADERLKIINNEEDGLLFESFFTFIGK